MYKAENEFSLSLLYVVEPPREHYGDDQYSSHVTEI